MKRRIFLITLILIMSLCLGLSNVYVVNATDDGIENLIASMNGTNDPADVGESRVGKVINTVIGLLQVAGSGISLIVITMLGIKYILASPSEKADVKKAIMPILIGCVLLFGAVNLMGMVASFSDDIFKTGP